MFENVTFAAAMFPIIILLIVLGIAVLFVKHDSEEE